MPENGPKTAALKVPVSLEGFTFRKKTQDWGITFALDPAYLKFAQPLQDKMNCFFVLVPFLVNDADEAKRLMEGEGLENITLDLGELGG